MQLQQPGMLATAGSLQAVQPLADGEEGGVNRVLATSFSDYKLIRRNGSVVGFEPGKIAVAMTKAFLAVHGSRPGGRSILKTCRTRSSCR